MLLNYRIYKLLVLFFSQYNHSCMPLLKDDVINVWILKMYNMYFPILKLYHLVNFIYIYIFAELFNVYSNLHYVQRKKIKDIHNTYCQMLNLSDNLNSLHSLLNTFSPIQVRYIQYNELLFIHIRLIQVSATILDYCILIPK